MRKGLSVSDARILEKKARERSHEEYLARQYPYRLREKRLEASFAAYMATTPGTKEALIALEKYQKTQAEYDGKHTGN